MRILAFSVCTVVMMCLLLAQEIQTRAVCELCHRIITSDPSLNDLPLDLVTMNCRA